MKRISLTITKKTEIKLTIYTLALLLLPVAALCQDASVSEESFYIIRVTAANEGVKPVVKVLQLEVEGDDARQFTRKTTPFEFKIDGQDFEALFKVASEGRIEVEFLGEENSSGEKIILRAISDGFVELSHYESPGGVISAWSNDDQ
ncbi:MAG TPA: hypothetical protein VF181_06790 [Balneolaceae bacterium]